MPGGSFPAMNRWAISFRPLGWGLPGTLPHFTRSVHETHFQCLGLVGALRGGGARHRNAEDATRIDLRHVRPVVSQHRQERN